MPFAPQSLVVPVWYRTSLSQGPPRHLVFDQGPNWQWASQGQEFLTWPQSQVSTFPAWHPTNAKEERQPMDPVKRKKRMEMISMYLGACLSGSMALALNLSCFNCYMDVPPNISGGCSPSKLLARLWAYAFPCRFQRTVRLCRCLVSIPTTKPIACQTEHSQSQGLNHFLTEKTEPVIDGR